MKFFIICSFLLFAVFARADENENLSEEEIEKLDAKNSVFAAAGGGIFAANNGCGGSGCGNGCNNQGSNCNPGCNPVIAPQPVVAPQPGTSWPSYSTQNYYTTDDYWQNYYRTSAAPYYYSTSYPNYYSTSAPYYYYSTSAPYYYSTSAPYYYSTYAPYTTARPSATSSRPGTTVAFG